MSLKNPASRTVARLRHLAFAGGFLAAFAATMLPAMAQDIQILRDTETEDMLRSYEAPLAKAAGLSADATKVWLVSDKDNTVNAFASFGDGGENIFMFAGIIFYTHTPNELIGVMAHETGHIKAGHLIRGEANMQKAMIPMLLSMVVGIAAMIAGAGQAGMVIMGLGNAVAEAQMNQFTRVQESTADQIGARLLNATHQSPMGMYTMFEHFAADEARGAYKIDPFAQNHPIGQARVSDLQDIVDASPYRDVRDSPQVTHTFEMVQAKLAGYVLPVQEALNRYPLTDKSEPARYARTMAYLRKPDLPRALAETNSLIQEEPNNPFFYEVLGQIYLSMAKPDLSIPAYQKAVDLRPGRAPQLRLGLATAQLATENAALAPAALQNLKAASFVENDDIFTWYETAQAYSMLKNEPMANLASAELHYNEGDMRQAIIFATRARRDLKQGSPDWQRANDIAGAAAGQAGQQR